MNLPFHMGLGQRMPTLNLSSCNKPTRLCRGWMDRVIHPGASISVHFVESEDLKEGRLATL